MLINNDDDDHETIGDCVLSVFSVEKYKLNFFRSKLTTKKKLLIHQDDFIGPRSACEMQDLGR